MSLLTKLTGSLPNLINNLQGAWDVMYKNSIPLNKEEQDAAVETLKTADYTSASGLLSAADAISSLSNDGWVSLDFDSFVDMQEIDETTITTHPIEKGSFRSENKVQKPKKIRVTLAKGGIGFDIETTLANIKSLVPKATNRVLKTKQGQTTAAVGIIKGVIHGLRTNDFSEADKNIKEAVKLTKFKEIPMEFKVITPFDMIEGLNLIKLDYTFKKENGRNLLLMDLTFQEILNKNTRVKSVKNPTDSSPQNIGRLSASII